MSTALSFGEAVSLMERHDPHSEAAAEVASAWLAPMLGDLSDGELGLLWGMVRIEHPRSRSRAVLREPVIQEAADRGLSHRQLFDWWWHA